MSYIPDAAMAIGTGLVALLLTGQIRRYALVRLLDIPNVRSSHVAPTPRGGGLAILLSFLAAILMLRALDKMDSASTAAIFGGSLLVGGIGFLDDHRDVPAYWRFLIHVLAVAWALAWLGIPQSLSALGFLGIGITAVTLVWLINLFNFMDGIDGIAGSQVIFLCLAAAAIAVSHAGQWQPEWLALAAATGGFLTWNWPPARIFLGDVGSGFLGFTLGCFMLADDAPTLIEWLILSGVFVVDATWTLVRRILAGERWWEGHRTHAYQHAAQRFGHRRVVIGICATNILFLLPVAWAAVCFPQFSAGLLILSYACLGGVAFRLKAGVRG